MMYSSLLAPTQSMRKVEMAKRVQARHTEPATDIILSILTKRENYV